MITCLLTLLIRTTLAMETHQLPEDTIIDGVPLQQGPIVMDDHGRVRTGRTAVDLTIGELVFPRGTLLHQYSDHWTLELPSPTTAWGLPLDTLIHIYWSQESPVEIRATLRKGAVVQNIPYAKSTEIRLACDDDPCRTTTVTLGTVAFPVEHQGQQLSSGQLLHTPAQCAVQ